MTEPTASRRSGQRDMPSVPSAALPLRTKCFQGSVRRRVGPLGLTAGRPMPPVSKSVVVSIAPPECADQCPVLHLETVVLALTYGLSAQRHPHRTACPPAVRQARQGWQLGSRPCSTADGAAMEGMHG